jgi:hypothetical protein
MPGILNRNDRSFRIVHCRPADPIAARWRACLADSDFPTHYTAPEYFLEPSLRHQQAFAILNVVDEEITAVLTGTRDGDWVRSGLPVRPQIAFSRRAERSRAMRNLITGLLEEAGSAKLIDLFVWSDMAGLVDDRFYQKTFEGVVMLDLSRGPDALFRNFSENKRTNIKKAIKYGVAVAPAKGSDDVSAYYAVYVDWSRRKSLPFVREGEFHETFALTDSRRLFLARCGGQIIAGVVVRFFPGGVMEYAANSSLHNALRLRPNDLLHWRAIEWAFGEGMTKYSLGGAHPFLRKFGGEIVPTIRYRWDLSTLRRYAIGDWIADRVERARPLLPKQALTLGRSLRRRFERLRA